MRWPLTAGAVGLAAGAAALWLRSRFLRFRTMALLYLQGAHPDLTLLAHTATGATARLAGMTVHIDLAPLFRSARGRLDAGALDRLVDAIRSELAAPQPAPLPLVRDRLLPMIKPRSFVRLYLRYPPAFHLVARPFPDELAVVYVIEAVHRITYVSAGMVARWKLPVDDVHELAVQNLRRRTAHLLAEQGGPARRYAHLDGFDAARILILDAVTPPEIPDPVAAIPDEQILLIAPRHESEALARDAQAAFTRGSAPLSPAVFHTGDAPLMPDVLS